MRRRHSGLVLWLVLGGLAIGCVLSLADGSEGALINPSLPGPYDVGHRNSSFEFGDTIKPALMTYYYPATSEGYDTPADASGAPYPTILWFYYDDRKYGNYPVFNLTYQEEIFNLVASYGFVVAVDYIEKNQESPDILSWAPCLDAWTAFVDKLEELDDDPTSPLYGMIDRERYGVLGHSGGIIAGGLAFADGRCEIAGFLSGRLNEDVRDYHLLEVPCHFQRAEFEGDSASWTVWGYRWAQGAKSQVLVKGADIYEGGYDLGMLVAFCLYYLHDEEDYRTFLYGDEVIDSLYEGEYGKIEFFVSEDEQFPPSVSIDVPDGNVYMEKNVTLRLDFEGIDLRTSYALWVEWLFDPDTGGGADHLWSVTYQFPDPGEYKVTAKWSIGEQYEWTVPYFVTVENMAPIAEPGEHRTVDMDEVVVFDGSASDDTSSHKGNLSYKWSFDDGVETGFSSDPTYTRALTRDGLNEITLTVRDPLGAEDLAVLGITVVNVAPTVTAEGNSSALEDDVLSFTGEGHDTESHLPSLKFQWDYGDGNFSEWDDSPYTMYIFTEDGIYDVTLKVEDPLGKEGNDTVRITIDNVVPEGGIEQPGDGDKLLVDTKLAFIGWGRDTASDHNTLRYTWDFGDGGTAEGAWVSYTYRESGEYDITLTVEDDDNATNVTTVHLTIQEKGETGIAGPMVVSASFLLVIILGLAAVATTEPGKYTLGLLTAPLFTRTKDVMDNRTRLALHGVIVENPGIHYSAIREELGLANGEAAYHLHVMERESFIRSVRDGKLKRFYTAHTRVPGDVGMSPEDTREAILELVGRRPGINQLEVMEELGLSRDKASYYLRELVADGRLDDTREGKFTVYRVK